MQIDDSETSIENVKTIYEYRTQQSRVITLEIIENQTAHDQK